MPDYPIPSFGDPSSFGVRDAVPPGYSASGWDTDEKKKNDRLAKLAELLGSGRAQFPGMQQAIGETRADLAALDPMEAGQKKALGVDMTQNTYPPRAPAAPTKGTEPSMQALTGLNPGNLDQFKDRPSPLGPGGDADFSKEMGRRRADADSSHIRFDPDGDGPAPMQDLAPRGDDTRGHSEMDWSKVANPMAFEAYRERPEIAEMERYLRDPLWKEKANTGLEIGKQGAVAQLKQQALLDAEASRRSAYGGEIDSALGQEREQLLGQLRGSPGFAALPPAEQARREALVDQHIQNKKKEEIGRSFAFGQKATGKEPYGDTGA